MAGTEDAPSRGDGVWNPQEITDLLIQAGRTALSLRSACIRELKADCSIVTEADRRIEALFAASFDRPPVSYLIGEETVAQKGEDYLQAALAGTTYVVDPIDGTSPYAHLLPNWGVSVGLLRGGKLTDGAVYLPDFRLLVLSDGPRVLEGTRAECAEEWSWRTLETPAVETGPSGLIAITQEIAKVGRVNIPNPVQALGAAVVPLVYLLEGRFLAYVGSLRLWDLAGSLPLLHRLKLSVTRLRARPPAPLGLEVTPQGYLLDPDDAYRWGVRGGVLVCPPSEEAWIRKAFGV
jgi:myo-inositol-1(or 4)-monophosphatase